MRRVGKVVVLGNRAEDLNFPRRRLATFTHHSQCCSLQPPHLPLSSFISSFLSSIFLFATMPSPSDPDPQGTSSHMMKTTKRGRPFLKVFFQSNQQHSVLSFLFLRILLISLQH